MITVVLFEIQTPGNLGAIARSMKNFGIKNLVLINPECSMDDQEALTRAMHAKDILANAKVKKTDYLKKFDIVVGTTAKTGSDYNISRVPITPKDFAKKTTNSKANIALLIGKEDIGLTNKEISKCDYIVKIPASKDYSTLNISHALAILLYEIFQAKDTQINKKFPPMTKTEKKIIFQKINNILDKMHFSTEDKRETQRKVWKRIIGKAMLTKREAFALLGFLRKLE
ncbi:MAG: tRNA (cytidine-2'-O-)-methyltransferase TrmJ [Candidatus Woesearchaeota archaeon]|nr:tRNA (cytidine-2'-O-)-methyltransferase TrmJ [Candidatus Woesearchaeota archaeon]